MIWLYFIQLFHLHHVIHLFQFIFSKAKLLMTTEPSKAPPLYPKTHLLAASGIAALLSLALLVFPSSDVEAKKTTLNLDLESPTQQLTQDQDAANLEQATSEAVASPFAQIENSTDDTQETAEAEPAVQEEIKAPGHKEVIVAKGDTLSTLFEKVGLPSTAVHEMLASDKQAKQFTQLKHGQKLEFELSPDGQLNTLHSKVSDLESITLTKGDKGFTFNRVKWQHKQNRERWREP
jgi:cell envelope opacity-associated protein A